MDDQRTDVTAEDRAAAEAAGAVLQTLAKAVRSFLLYLPNNPLRRKFLEDFRNQTEEFLAAFGPLELRVDHTSLVCRGVQVYTHPDLRENLAFRMFADGIRSLSLDPAVEQAELEALVGILSQVSGTDAEDDVATRLWAAELPHVGYTLADFPTASAADLGVTPAAPGAVVPVRGPAEAPQPAAVTPPQVVPSQVFLLSEDEIRGLEDLAARDEKRTPVDDVVEVLAAIFQGEVDDDLLEELRRIVAHLSGDLILTGRTGEALAILRRLREVALEPGLPPGRASVLESIPGMVLGPETRRDLEALLTSGKGPGRQELVDLLAVLGRDAVEPFCGILAVLPGKDERKALLEGLVEVGKNSPELFLPHLRDPRWFLVRNVITILRRIGNPLAAAAVREATTHADGRVRREAVLFFEQIPDPAVEPTLLGLLEDEVPAIRRGAIRALVRLGSPSGGERLLAKTASTSFWERSPGDREGIMEGLADLLPQRSLALCREFLARRHLFNQSLETEEAAAAVAGLKRLGTQEALDILRQAAGTRKGAAARLVEAAIPVLAQTVAQGGRRRTAEGDGA
jgi:hypothetical protein